jgi:DNA polymerase elongation subunit (family B)
VPAAVTCVRRQLERLWSGHVPPADLIITNRLSREPGEYTAHTVTAEVARQLVHAGIHLSPGENVRFLLVPGPEKARAWELISGPIPYDKPAYTELVLRAVESLLVPVGVDRPMLDIWLRGEAGYWGPPGTLPPPGIDGGLPLLASHQPPDPSLCLPNAA